MHFKNNLYFFSASRYDLLRFEKFVDSFLSFRGFSNEVSIMRVDSIPKQLNFEGWELFFSRSGHFYGTISLDNLRSHKRNIKIVLKSSFSENFTSTLTNLNLLIANWSSKYGYADFITDVFSELDVYLYKIIWNWAKRRHPRRPTTWIYSKYWQFSVSRNLWTFFFIDYSSGKILYLAPHRDYILKLYCIPSSMSVFALQNTNKLGLIWLKKYTQTQSSVILFLYKSQSGRCFCCNRLFTNIGFGRTRIIKISKTIRCSYLSDFALIHIYCSIFIYLKIYFCCLLVFYDES